MMHPAPSLILFSSLSGLGLGLLAWLGIGLARPQGAAALALTALGLALAGAGLAASAFHLRRPSRAVRAWTQWRSSWLSREALAAPAALVLSALHGLLLALRGDSPAWLGAAAALFCLFTVLCTAMIYAQLRAVPAWNGWMTPALFLALALAGGALLLDRAYAALPLLAAAGLFQHLHWRRTARPLGFTLANATGLTGAVRSFAPPHTGQNYLLREMVFRVGRARAGQLRLVAATLGYAVPAVVILLPLPAAHLVAALVHLGGVLASRWLFFAEARHTTGLYYGA
jgi:DMSO reductase anchor subunit